MSVKNRLKLKHVACALGCVSSVAMAVVACGGGPKQNSAIEEGKELKIPSGAKVQLDKTEAGEPKGLMLGIVGNGVGNMSTNEKDYVLVTLFATNKDDAKKKEVKAYIAVGGGNSLQFHIPLSDYNDDLGTDLPFCFQVKGCGKKQHATYAPPVKIFLTTLPAPKGRAISLVGINKNITLGPSVDGGGTLLLLLVPESPSACDDYPPLGKKADIEIEIYFEVYDDNSKCFTKLRAVVAKQKQQNRAEEIMVILPKTSYKAYVNDATNVRTLPLKIRINIGNKPEIFEWDATNTSYKHVAN